MKKTRIGKKVKMKNGKKKNGKPIKLTTTFFLLQ